MKGEKMTDNERLVSEAARFAEEKHQGQVRKGTERPYIVHPRAVLEIAATMTSEPYILAAAVLHDTIEDTGTTREDIEERFGKKVADLVDAESQEKGKSWYERKSHTIEHVKAAKNDVKIVCLADKLANIRDMYYDHLEAGEELWKRFKQHDPSVIGWYYRGVMEALRKDMSDFAAFKELEEIYGKLFGKYPELSDEEAAKRGV